MPIWIRTIFAKICRKLWPGPKKAVSAKSGNVFLGPQAYHENRGLFADYPEVFFLLGVHPNDSGKFVEEDIDAMREASRMIRV